MRRQDLWRKNGAVRAQLLLAAGIWVGCACGFALAQHPAPASVQPHSAYLAPSARIDINHAGVAELLKIPGMTRTWAERIVRFRPYRTKQDLLDRGVVTGSVYDRIRDSIIAHRKKQ